MIRLTSLKVVDFRSIRGTLTVPLDAPVVLIHGQNGTGKTSLLSAIELGLTGNVPSFARADPEYLKHLVHKEKNTSRVEVSAVGVANAAPSAAIQIAQDGISGIPLLQREQGRYYSERCFLAQSALGRLLELYEDKDARKSDSRLTKFVKDLLGLDQLDALIDGLYDAGDVRRFRTSVPMYAEVRDNIPKFTAELNGLRLEVNTLLAANARTLAAIRVLLPLLEVEETALSDSSTLGQRLRGVTEERELQHLARLRRELLAAEQQCLNIAAHAVDKAQPEAEKQAALSAAALQAWRVGAGSSLGDAFARFASLFPDRQIEVDSDPHAQYRAAVAAVQADLARLTSLLQRAAEDDAKLLALDQSISRGAARAAALDAQIGAEAQGADQKAKMLSDVVPYLHEDQCPVCGRDYKEVSASGLHSYLSDRIRELTESAGRLQALSRERALTGAALAEAQRERDTLDSRRLDVSLRDMSRTREAELKELAITLNGLESVAVAGQTFATEATSASRKLMEMRSRDLQSVSINDLTTKHASALGVPGPSASETQIETLNRLKDAVVAREKRLESTLASRRQALELLAEYERNAAKRVALEKQAQVLESQVADLTERKEAADALIVSVRELARNARDTRTAIVRRVFNNSLNAIWRDLFLRLAPEEPFVPAFALPEAPNGAIEATLQTHYRAGGKGGNPRAMLSAGNLNTAALTLFLALHLSVAPTLPWLVIDDPVQSMDEVHISQFAALLRTISKAHGRQVIMAVHERQLFEYLALELSPAFESDRLITIELSRGSDGRTLMDYRPVIWQPDTAIAA